MADRFRAHSRTRARRRGWVALLLLMVMLFSLVQMLYVFEGSLRPMLMVIAKSMARQYATQAINDAITQKIAEETESAELVSLVRDNNGKVTSASFNFVEGARIQSQVTYRVQKVLDDFGKSGAQIQLPVGQLMHSSLLAHYGPVVPVSITPYGTVFSQLKVENRDLGVNQSVHILYLFIRASVSVIVPFVSEPATVESKVPIAYVVFTGEVPQTFYDATRGLPPNLSLPGSPVPPSSATKGSSSVDLGEPTQPAVGEP